MNFLNVSTYATSASTTKVLVLDGNNTVKSRTAAQILSDGGGGTARSATLTFADSKSWTQQFLVNGTDFYGGSALATGVVPLNPTNYRFSFYNINADATGSETVGFYLYYSTDNSTWTSTANLLPARAADVNKLVSITGTLSISGSPTAVYFKVVQVNTTGGNRSIWGGMMNATFWN